ncbi:MAG: hypothetical protein GY703_16695 [Gammaproteobacteria bacterium]|nr:hypothetical protein [Gammaproteobacteria bacterium]
MKPTHKKTSFKPLVIAFPFLLAMLMLVVVLLSAVTNHALAADTYPERWYQQAWCIDGQMEHTLPDRTRVDCLTATHAIEIDFGRKWAEGVSQALWYGLQTGRRAGLVLILERPPDMKHFHRAAHLIKELNLPVTLWGVGP